MRSCSCDLGGAVSGFYTKSYYEILPAPRGSLFPEPVLAHGRPHITRRNKAKIWGHSDSGWKDPSELTVYVGDDAARDISGINFSSANKVRILFLGDKLLLTSHVYGRARGVDGKFSYTLEPEVGLHPLELWRPENVEILDKRGKPYVLPGYLDNHPGHAIVRLKH